MNSKDTRNSSKLLVEVFFDIFGSIWILYFSVYYYIIFDKRFLLAFSVYTKRKSTKFTSDAEGILKTRAIAMIKILSLVAIHASIKFRKTHFLYTVMKTR